MAEKSVLPTIVFVYNADSGLLNLLADTAHRAVRPSTYPCKLCAVTYSFQGMKREWREFLDGLDIPCAFLHRDELQAEYGIEGVALPAVFLDRDGTLELWIDAESINTCRSLDDLKQLVAKRHEELDRVGFSPRPPRP